MSTSAAAGRFALLALCLSAGLAGLSVAITGPILVDIAAGFEVSVPLAGQLMTVGSLAGMFGTLGLSPLLDRIARREAVCAALGLIALAAVVCALAPSFVVLAVAYSFIGLGAYTLLALVLAGAGDLYPGEGLGRAMGWIVAGNVGLIVVSLPAISALAERFGWPVAFLLYAGIATLVAVLAFRAIPAGVYTQQAQQTGYLASFGRVFRNRTVAFLLLTVAIYHASIYGFGTFMGAVAIQGLGATTAQMGPVFSLRFLGTAVAGVLGGRYLRATDWRLAASASLACAVLSVAGYVAPGNMWWFSFVALLHGCTVGLIDVSLNSLLVSVETAGRCSVTALRSFMDSMGGVAGPALGGAVIAMSGYPMAGWLFAVLAVAAALSTYAGARAPRAAVAAAPR